MASFSERLGYKTAKAIQFESISNTLRNRIWNLFYMADIQRGGLASKRVQRAFAGQPAIEDLVIDKLGFTLTVADVKFENKKLNFLQEHLTNCPWNEVYEFVEAHVASVDEEDRTQRMAEYNALFEAEKSGYRFVNGELAAITNPEEISVKESISAVEALCSAITGQTGAQATLGKMLSHFESKGIRIPPAMKSAYSSLYGYTSNEGGIRHGSMDFKDVPAEDAKYMLVSCSAFINYLIEKWSKHKDE